MRQRSIRTSLLIAATVSSAIFAGSYGWASATTKTTTKTTKKTTKTTAKKASTATKAASVTTVATSAGSATGEDTTPKVVAATEAFLATLDASAKAKVLFANDAKKSDWSNLPDGLFKRDGLRLADMTAAQQAAGWKVLETLLSPTGYQKVKNITLGDAALATQAGSKNGLDFGGDRYWFRILGTPSKTSRWILQFGGHHLAVNATIVGSRITLGPTLLAAQPSEFTLNGATVRPLKAETDLAFAAIAALSDAQKSKISSGPLGELVLGAGADGKTVAAEGIALSELSASQQAAVWAVVESWMSTLNAEDAALKLAEIKSTLGETKFLWGGSTTTGNAAYYRIQGPKVYIEFSHQVGGGANAGGWTHIHAIYRDPSNDYGASFAA